MDEGETLDVLGEDFELEAQRPHFILFKLVQSSLVFFLLKL